MKIEFVNHASVKIYTDDAVILTDPWFEGSVFNEGWDLLAPGPEDLDTLLADVTHIWVSHEHPDHFSPAFFGKVSDAHKQKLTILFQKTRDRRVAAFLEKKGFKIDELPDGELRKIGTSTEFVCGKSEFYDSYLFLRDKDRSILNLNDCPMAEPAELRGLKDRFGAPDVLLTQFSYAAWKGGRDNRKFREEAARQKLETLATQVRETGAGYVIPFASFVYFSHEENNYLNDSINRPEDVIADEASHGAQTVVMRPSETWEVGTPHDNEAALGFWSERYEEAKAGPYRAAAVSVPLEELKVGFEAYRTSVFEENSYGMALLARYNPIIRGFLPVRILLTDLEAVVSVSVMDGFEPVQGAHDVAMHSSSLKFIFDNGFGFDTLTVNGRFEATSDGFSKLTRSFAIGSLNGMGITLGYATLFRADLILRLLSRLTRVQKKLKDQAS